MLDPFVVFIIIIVANILGFRSGAGCGDYNFSGEMPKRINHNIGTVYSKTNKSDNLKKKKYLNKKKNLQKQLKSTIDSEKNKDETVLLRNISHKNSAGCNNWKKFIEMEGGSNKLNVSNNTVNKKLPLMKSGLVNENKDKSIFPLLRKRPGQKAKITKLVAMDCEMVGVGENGSVSVLARVSLVNSFGECIYDKYVKPTENVTDYRTFVSGIRPHHLENGEDFFKVQQEVASILKGRTLIGHALKHDLEVLILRHPRRFTRDTVTFLKFRKEAKGTLSLKNLTQEFLNVKIQDGEHDSIEDAKAAMQLYMTYRKEWEEERRTKWLQKKEKVSKPSVAAVEMI